MSLSLQIEPLCPALWAEVLVLANEHWASTKSYRRHEPFNPSYERYKSYNDCGFFRLVTARDEDALVGYFGVYVMPSMHSQLLTANEDTLFLAPSHRGGTNAFRFIKHIIAQCSEWRVHELLFSCEIDNETGIKGILLKLDFKPVIMQYSLRLSLRADSAITSNEASHVGNPQA